MKYAINHEFVSITSQTATHRIILIHGWGADADDLLSLGKEITDRINFDYEVISLRGPGLHPSGQGRQWYGCLLYTSPSPRDLSTSRMPSSA